MQMHTGIFSCTELIFKAKLMSDSTNLPACDLRPHLFLSSNTMLPLAPSLTSQGRGMHSALPFTPLTYQHDLGGVDVPAPLYWMPVWEMSLRRVQEALGAPETPPRSICSPCWLGSCMLWFCYTCKHVCVERAQHLNTIYIRHTITYTVNVQIFVGTIFRGLNFCGD